MLDEAIGDMHDVMRAELEQTELRRVQTTADGEPCPLPKTGHLPGNHRNRRQPVVRGELAQGAVRAFCNAAFAETRAAGAGRTMSADHVT